MDKSPELRVKLRSKHYLCLFYHLTDGNMEIMATGDEEPQAIMRDSSTDTSTDDLKI